MGDRRASETLPPPTSDAEPRFVQTRSHVEGLRLAAAAKLPPLLICVRATRQPRRKKKGDGRGRQRRWRSRGG